MSGNNRQYQALEGGFTLIELLITLMIAVILATVAVPSFSSYIDNQRVRAGAQELYGGFQFARSEAIKRNEDVTINSNDGDWSTGWTITVGGNTLRQHGGLDGLVLANDPADSVTFNASGRPANAAMERFDLCNTAQEQRITRRVVEITTSGRPRLERDGSCS